jgi:hypothetical protein
MDQRPPALQQRRRRHRLSTALRTGRPSSENTDELDPLASPARADVDRMHRSDCPRTPETREGTGASTGVDGEREDKAFVNTRPDRSGR